MKCVTILLLVTLATAAAAQNRPRRPNPFPPPAGPVYKDTVGGLAFDSLAHDLGRMPTRGVFSLVKTFKVVSDTPVIITGAWTPDPHFICDYPREPLLPGKTYSFKTCFTFQYRHEQLNKQMGFYLLGNQLVTFHFKGNLVAGSNRGTALDRFLDDPTIYTGIKWAYINELTRPELEADHDLQFRISSLVPYYPPHRASEEAQIQRQQFNLRAFLNMYRLVRTSSMWRSEFGHFGMLFIQSSTKAFAACYNGTNGFTERDLPLWAEIIVTGLRMAVVSDKVPFNIDAFIKQLQFNIRQSPSAQRAVIDKLVRVLKEQLDTTL